MKASEFVTEKWSQKYKSSINCSHPKGFSQRAHCAGKKKHNESVEMEQVCPDCGMCQTHGNISEVKQRLDAKCWAGKHKEGTKIKGGVRVNNCVPNESVAEGSESFRNKIRDALWYAYQQDPMIPPAPHEQSPEDMEQDEYEDFEDAVDDILQFALAKNITNAHLAVAKHGDIPFATGDEHRTIQEKEMDETAAWKRKEGKSKKGGLNAKGVASYRKEHPGSKLQTAVTTKPSKLKPGSKPAKRRKSFCARMSGVKGPMKKPNGKPTRKALALRKWNCE